MWYFNSLRVPGELDVSGASIPGIPFVWIGRNQHVSWGITPSSHSTVEEIIITDSAAAVEETITTREEVIRVRGLEESLVHFARRTVVGPVISDRFSPVLFSAMQMYLPNCRHVTLNTAALRPNLSIAFLQKLNQAANEEQVHEAAVEPSQLDNSNNGDVLAKPDITSGASTGEQSDRMLSLLKCDLSMKSILQTDPYSSYCCVYLYICGVNGPLFDDYSAR